MLPVTADAEFVTDLRDALLMVHGASAALPSAAVLAEATNLAHQLSTQQYEGKPLRSALVLVRNASVPMPAGVALRHVTAPKAHLRALCAAFPEGLVLAPSEDGARCEVHAGLPLGGLGPAAVAELRFQCPGVVSVHARGFLVAMTRAGSKPVVFARPPSLDMLLKPAALSGPGAKEPELGGGDLLALLRAVHGVGSGGTLVVVPARAEVATYGDSVQQLAGAEIAPWRFAGEQARHLRDPAAIEEMLGETFSGTGIMKLPEARAHWMAEIRNNTAALLSASLSSIGQLARADGAILLRRDLALLAFGVRLSGKGRAKPPRVLDVQGAELPALAGGTRLEGALSFVAAHPDCVAFVLSADGPLRMVSAGKGGVTVQADLEAFL